MDSHKPRNCVEPAVLGYATAGADSSPVPWYIPLSLAVTGVFAIAMVIPSFTCSHRGAEVPITRSKVAPGGPIGSALVLFRDHTGAYPSLLAELTAGAALLDYRAETSNWQGPYLQDAAQTRDAWNNPLMYRCPGLHNPNGYDLWSVGADAIDGTDDDIGNW